MKFKVKVLFIYKVKSKEIISLSLAGWKRMPEIYTHRTSHSIWQIDFIAIAKDVKLAF